MTQLPNVKIITGMYTGQLLRMTDMVEKVKNRKMMNYYSIRIRESTVENPE